MAYAPQEEHSREKAQSALGHEVGLGLVYSGNSEEASLAIATPQMRGGGTRKSWRGGQNQITWDLIDCGKDFGLRHCVSVVDSISQRWP